MRAPRPRHWWALLAAAITIVMLWPPADGKSLAVTLVNWAVDPAGTLPVLPEQLPIGAGDDPIAVEVRDALVRDYDARYAEGGWTRRRLALKVAGEPLAPAVMRQLLTAAAVILVAVAWRIAGRRD
jgi:hypothetical protein